jgi:hypothetical protein
MGLGSLISPAARKVAAKKAGKTSPKLEAEIKAARPSKAEMKELKKEDTPRIKELEKVKKNIGQDQIGKINRLFAEKAEGNFKGKQQMLLAAGPAKGFDKAADKLKDLFDKIKSGKYTQKQYRDFNLAKNKKLTKTMLTIQPKNPADLIKGTPDIPKGMKKLTTKEIMERLKKKRENKAQGGMGLKMPTANQTGLKKLPTKVRNQMGYMYGGGMGKKPRMSKMDYRKGGMVIIALDMKKKGKK